MSCCDSEHPQGKLDCFIHIWVRLQIMEDSFESVNKSVDLDNPSEHSVDLDEPGKQCSKDLSDDLPSDSSLGRLMDTSSQDENDFQLAVPKVENIEDMGDIHVDKSQNSLVNVTGVTELGGKVLEKEEVEEQDSISEQASSGEEYGEEQQRTSGEGRRCSARLQGRTRKRWTSKDHYFIEVKAE